MTGAPQTAVFIASTASPSPETIVTPSSSPPSLTSLWSDLFTKSHIQKPFPPPSFTSDGIPIVKAPPEILLKASEAWKDHLICSFFGSIPPLKKFFSDLNPIWGKQGMISVRAYAHNSCLIHVPSAQTRIWILEMGMWRAGTVAFSARAWSPSPSLHSQVLLTAPLWLSFQGVPPQLWSWKGFGLIASSVGSPIPPRQPHHPPPVSFDPPKILAVVPLDKPLPSSVYVQDDEGVQVLIGLTYLNLPPLCPVCTCYGHRAHRCPHRVPAKAPP